ncbi:aldolase [Photobacterium damselae]|uniref:3-oxo-tetronate 4-phosphate decarboxylase n=1 Tax=Photobacterium damselae TaxID=38293 RepID=UPI000D661CC5|nr:aldolase [Photobacterium damselae]AWK84052.1 aldolase [Photobacterium damselae]
MNEKQIRQQIVELALSMFNRGYATGGSGNLSVKLPNGYFLATPTGSSFGRLVADELSVVDDKGNLISGKKASKEVTFHLELYRNNPNCNAVVHLHSTYLTALSCLNDLDPHNAIKPFTPYYVMRIGQMPVIPYLRPGHPQIAQELGKLAADYRAFLLANHGPVVTGIDLEDAINNAEELEETAKLMFLLKDHSIRYLTKDEVSDLLERGK